MNLIEAHSLSKNFGGIQALLDVKFSVQQGEIVGLIGANGAGKTTLFSVISGFYRPDSGEVTFNGQDITGKKPFEICRLGLVRTFQVVKPFLNMTVRKNVMVGKLFGRSRITKKETAKIKADEIIEFVGLGDKSDVPARELTLADHKRLEIARSLSADPDLLLLDEVLAGLTPTETSDAMKLVENIRQRGIAILMVEHVMKAVVGLCDRIMVLHYGCKIAEGSPKEVVENPEVIEAYLGENLNVCEP
jgi:branched-chain amino acid transport system ATP-binding protein